MKLQKKIQFSILAIFIPTMIGILGLSFHLKQKYQEAFYQEAETVANFVDYLCQNEIKKINLAIKAVLNDHDLATYLQFELKNSLQQRCRELRDKFNLTAMAVYNFEHSTEIVDLPPQTEGRQFPRDVLLAEPGREALSLTEINQQLYLVYRQRMNNRDHEPVGFLAFALPFPSESFQDDVYSQSAASLKIAFWRGAKLLNGSPDLKDSNSYRQQRPTSKRRLMRLESGIDLVGFTYPMIDLTEISGIVDLVFEILIDTTPAAEITEKIFFVTMSVVLFVIGLFSLVLFGLGHYIVRPLQQITKAARETIEKGTLPEYQPLKRRDEIGYLWSVGSKMASSLYEAKTRAEEANRAKSEFLANMSHEIRTPLNAILGFTQILEEHPLTSEEKRYLNYISEAGDHLLSIINEILDIAKIESGSMLLEETNFDLNLMLDEIGTIIRGRMKPDIEYRLPHIQGLDAVIGDPLKLKQVIINLINNANKFTEKGCIELQATINQIEDDDLEVLFFVRDTGKGIARENQALIFESFAQEDSSITRKFGGTGLGLTISRKMVEMMGGRMWLESEPGQGSTFYFTVKLKRAEKLTAATQTSSPDRDKLKGRHYAIVDDNPLNLLIMKELLKPYSDRVDSFEQAADFLQALEGEHKPDYDIIVTDIQMPDISGLDLARRIRASGCTTPIIAASSENILNYDIQKNFDEFIYKPILRDELLTAIERLLATSAQADDFFDDDFSSKSPFADLRLLVAEDNRLNQMLIKKVLSDLEPAVLDLAENGRQAVDMTEKNEYDLILMDVNMPVLDGINATREIRRRKPDLPIFALTANTMSGDKEKCLAAGMNGFIGKPVKLDELKAVLARQKVRQP